MGQLAYDISSYSGGRALNAIFTAPTLRWSERLTLLFLTSRMNPHGDFAEAVTASSQTVARETGLCPRSAQYALRDLRINGFLSREHRREGDQFLPNSYQLTPRLFDDHQASKGLTDPAIIRQGGRALNACFGTGLSPHATLILLRLSAKMNYTDFSKPEWISIARIARETGHSRATVFRVLKELERAGFLARRRRSGKHGQNLANDYVFKPGLYLAYQARREQPNVNAANTGVERSAPSSSSSPAVTPPSSLVTKPPSNLSDTKEAHTIGALVFMPAEGSGQRTFVDTFAVRGLMELALSRSGIEALRLFRDRVTEKEMLGEVKFNQQRVLEWIAMCADDLRSTAPP